MLEHLLTWDEALFYTINNSHLPWIDQLMPYYRHKLFWAPLYIFFISFLIWNFPKNGLWILLFTILAVGVSDTISSKLIKKTVKRERPCNNLRVSEKVILRIRCGGGYSFTSSHATNHAALASFLYFIFQGVKKKWRALLLVWAVSIGVAQIYVGVHYPLDVVVGLLIGTGIGWLMAFTFQRFIKLE